MEPGPTTARPDRALADVRKDLRQHGAEHVVVTTVEESSSIAERRDIEHRLSPAGQSQKVVYRSDRGQTPMIEVGSKLSSEECRPADLVSYARQAEEAGFAFAMISDHYHPWIARQGQSPFVWSISGAITQVTERLCLGRERPARLSGCTPHSSPRRPRLAIRTSGIHQIGPD
jgi:hypothetical protein